MLDGFVDTVHFAGDLKGRCCLLMLGGVEHFVDVGGATQPVDGDFGDFLLPSVSILRCLLSSRSCQETRLDAEICVQQHLKLEALLPLILHIEHRLQAILTQRHAVHQSEIKRPRFLRLGAELCGRKPEIELDAVISTFGKSSGLGRAAAQIFPGRVTCESVLGQSTGCVVFGRWAEDL